MSEIGISQVTELTPLQERAVYLLAGGKNITDTAKDLQTDRATLYSWQKQAAFEAFYNKVRGEYKEQAKNELISLYGEALKAIKACLNSNNENVKLKTAVFILEQGRDFETGLTDKKQIERARAMEWGY